MSTPNGTGAGRRLRIAGLALLGLAVIAVAIGVAVATTGGERTSVATGPPPVSATPDPRPSTIPYPPVVTSSSAPVPEIPESAVVAPPEADVRAPVGDKSSRNGEVRVYNNSMIRGLAARAAADLAAAGWTVVEVGNYARGTIPTTTAYYQQDTDQRAEAEALGDEFAMRVEPRFPGIAHAGPGLIVIVTNDYTSP
ncbi:MAG TPA: LytR C-terminal domain-containing protein [Pseudonocardiaceae bacterium]|nr:LytR C-terminal domain-containing protein [Pseudonocardiaceae bacterium]